MMGYVTFLQMHTESGKKYFSYCIKLQRLRTQMCKVILNPYNQSTKKLKLALSYKQRANLRHDNRKFNLISHWTTDISSFTWIWWTTNV